MIDKHFKSTDLGKYFNRQTIKVSYSCLPNIESIISSHNTRILKSENPLVNQLPKLCNCRQGIANCPLNGRCLQSSIIYKADIKSPDISTSYIGLSANTFKERFNNHNQTFKHIKYEHSTTLSKHIWSLKNQNKAYTISWSIIGKSDSYQPGSKLCSLCNLEKTLILNYKHGILNQRSEIMNKCRHRRKYLLSNYL